MDKIALHNTQNSTKGDEIMRKRTKFTIIFLTVVLFITILMPSAFAKDFAPKFDTNIGVNTQYAYSENNISWLRQLTIKEDMLSVDGIMTEAVLHPVTAYPYTSDAPHFKAQVEEYTKIYTLDEESQRAAYLYLLDQIGALTIISEPTVSNQTKADWLREQGIVITPEDEADAERVLMISALYAMMRNDFCYVITGKHLDVPQGTPMEEALIMHIVALSGNENSLTAFMIRFFGKTEIASLEDYIYYTSLMALYVNGYVSVKDITKLDRDEIFKRVAIMTIRGYGISIDSEKATHEEIADKYLTAMLGEQYEVALDPEALIRSRKAPGVPYYILQRMAYEDANVTISHKKYSYDECFDIVLRKTDRFDLEKEFYSDIYEYDVFLEAKRDNISINPNPLTQGTVVYINGRVVQAGKYAIVQLSDAAKQTINIVTEYKANGVTTKSTYNVVVHQGQKAPEDSNITGIVPTYGPTQNNTPSVGPSTPPSLPAASPLISNVNNAAMGILGNVLSVNDKGQLVDQNGNIISQGNYEQLPDNYKYVVNDDGIISVVLVSDTTQASTSTADGSNLSDEDTRKIVIIVASGLCLLLIIALIAVVVVSKKTKNDAAKVRARRQKELKKKAKAEAKADKKSKK